jgi:3-oxochol-4-en-24-oyl-CoA dehydrogenase
MALGITAEHRELAESVRGWAGRHASAPTAEPDRLLAALAAQGLLGLHLPEEHGGQGYRIEELAVATEELGRALVPGAFLPTVLASALLMADGAAPARLGKLLAGLADGSRPAAVSLAPLAGRAGEAGGTVVLDGSCGPVLGGDQADLVIMPVQTPDGEIWAAVDADGLDVTTLTSLDVGRPVARVRADQLTVPADRILTGLTRAAVTGLAATLFAAEACGIADWAVQTAAGYARTRQQFGRPIGQFQAVKHRCARMLTVAEEAAAAAWDAARAANEAGESDGAAGGEREFAAAVAAVVAVDAAVSCTHECIQVLGGIGYTWEHAAHLYYRRALSLRALLGPASGWARRVADLALEGVRRPLAVDLPAGAESLRAGIRAQLAAIAAGDPQARRQRLAGEGWVMPHLPAPWGRDAGPVEQIVIAEEMKRAGLRAPALLIGAWVVPALARYGTREQQDRFLPATLRGDITWCQLFSEPGAGSDLAGLATRAERVTGDAAGGGGWRLTGQKVWTSLAKEADWAICVARTDPARRRQAGISYFLVDMKSPGVTVRPLREMTGDSLFNEVFLDGVLVPDDLVVGEVNEGWPIARTTLANERVSLSRSWTFGCGTDELLDMLRGLDGGPDDVLLAEAGRLISEGHAIDALGMRVTLKHLSGTEPGATGSVHKLVGMRHAQQVAEFCWVAQGPAGALGWPGPAGEPPGGPHWARQVLLTRALTIGGGTTDIQLNIIGERILGLPRDPDPPA